MTFSSDHALTPMIEKLCRRSTLGTDEISALEALPHRVEKVERGQFIVREGDRPSHCAVILSGFLYRSNLTGAGGRQVSSVHLHGDLVCACDILLDEAGHSIQALTDARLAFVRRDVLLVLAEAYPALARALWMDNIVNGSVSREWLINIGRRDAYQRIAHIICEFATRSEAAGLGNRMEYIWPLTQEELGDATGLTAVHVNRTLQRLRREELVKLGRGELHVIDWAGLRFAGDFRPGYLHESAAAGSEI